MEVTIRLLNFPALSTMWVY